MPTSAERVRQLVRDSAMSQHQFAAAIGLDDSKLSKSLSGARRFTSADLARVAELCSVTVDWLVTGDPVGVAVAARTTSGLAGTALGVAERLGAMRVELAQAGYPQPWRGVDAPPGIGRWAEYGAALADAAVARITDSGGQAGDRDLAGVIERAFGVDVAIAELDEGFDGMAVSSAQVKLIILNRTVIPGRQRFTLAHELGHLLADDDQGTHLDEDIFDTAQQRQPSEKRANAFAVALLMPDDTLRSAAGRTGLTEDGFAVLACDLAVSPSTLAYRLLSLRLIDAGTCERLRGITGADAARLAGRAQDWVKLVASANAPRPPGLLLRDAFLAHATGVTSARFYADLLGSEADEAE